MKKIWCFILIVSITCSCAVQRTTTSEEFSDVVRKDVPFKVSEFKTVNEYTYSFRCDGIVALLPDYEVDKEGATMVYQTTFMPNHAQQTSAIIWRNIVINKRDKRVVCIDRFVRNGRTFGYVYFLQSETRKYNGGNTFHWNVSDPKLMLNVSDAIEGMSDLSITTLNMQ